MTDLTDRQEGAVSKTIATHERNGWVFVYWDMGPDADRDIIIARFGGRRPLDGARRDAAFLTETLKGEEE